MYSIEEYWEKSAGPAIAGNKTALNSNNRYQKLIHIYSASIEEPDDAPEGDPQAARADPYFHSRQEFFKQWSIAGRRQATGLLVVQAPGDRMVAILNEKGEPIKKVE